MFSSEGLFLSPQVKCSGPGLEPLGCIINKPADFTIDTSGAGRGELKLFAQVRLEAERPNKHLSEDILEHLIFILNQ